jgi:hypothetical protein
MRRIAQDGFAARRLNSRRLDLPPSTRKSWTERSRTRGVKASALRRLLIRHLFPERMNSESQIGRDVINQ